MDNIYKIIEEKSPLTLGEVFSISEENRLRVVDVILIETEIKTKLTKEEILEKSLLQFNHNFKAIEIGLTSGESLLFGKIGAQLKNAKDLKLYDGGLIDKILINTLAAQVGNHAIGLSPCAGTGDSCPYTGFLKALTDSGYDLHFVSEIACILLKVGSVFRVGKTTTGCNMEGFGAGAAAISAAYVELNGGTARDMERAMVLAISPTIGVPCTPRVMVPGLCATHIGGAVLIGTLSATLAIETDIEVNVPIDVMMALATEVHPISAETIVPTVVKYMQPFFKTKDSVENLIDHEIKTKENEIVKDTIEEAKKIAKRLANEAAPITGTLGEAVVGGSSQAVGSPTNAARIAHKLSKGDIKKVKIELYPELFARRGINIPGILMGAIFGSSTSDYKMYEDVMEKVEDMGIEVEIIESEIYQQQKITIETNDISSYVDALNRGGGRLVVRDTSSSEEKVIEIAKELGIVLV